MFLGYKFSLWVYFLGVIANGSGMKVIDFANTRLFEKLGNPFYTNKEDSTKE